ncbi:Abi-alpha family protein [Dyadobacter bucti]|uniref:Abi-alpha family protein n=1 Tax=Dyadobacter bucti TaxID=2572203 RepID=UPI0011088A19|nr:Abi-alpha family protein [Dyadobacter bucti]
MTPEEIKAGLEIVKMANEWAKLIFADSAKQFGMLLGDMVHHKRESMKRNWELTSGKIHTIIIEEKVVPKEISSKALVPMIEGIQLEEDDDLQNMWASMFVNYVDSSRNLNVVVYPNILRQLSTSEVRILKYLSSEKRPHLYRHFKGEGPCPYTDEEVNNLVRLSLIKEILEHSYNTKKDATGSIPNFVKTKQTGRYQLTEFGDDFLDSCHRTEIDQLEKIRRKSGRR